LVGLGVEVARRAALDDVADVAAVPGEAELLEHELVEELARAPDERLAEAVLLGAGALAHEEEVGLGVAHAEDDLRAPGGGQLATGAAECGDPELVEGGRHGVPG